MMPQVDGWEMLQRVQERHGVGAIPVIMFSGKVDEEALKTAASSGRPRLRRQALQPAAADRLDEAAHSGLSSLDTRLERWVVLHRAHWLDELFIGSRKSATRDWSGSSWPRSRRCTGGDPRFSCSSCAGNVLAEWGSWGLRQAIGRERPPHRFPDPLRSCTCRSATASRRATRPRALPAPPCLRG